MNKRTMILIQNNDLNGQIDNLRKELKADSDIQKNNQPQQLLIKNKLILRNIRMFAE